MAGTDRSLGGGTAPDVVTRAMPDTLAAVGDQVSLELAEHGHQPKYVRRGGETTAG